MQANAQHNSYLRGQSHLVRQVILWWEWPIDWSLKAWFTPRKQLQIPLDDRETFSLKCCFSHWVHSLLPSSAHNPNSLSPTTICPENFVLQEQWNKWTLYTLPLPPSFLLQVALYAGEASRIKILCKDTRKQMMCGNIQSLALHIYIYIFSTPARFTANQLWKVLSVTRKAYCILCT